MKGSVLQRGEPGYGLPPTVYGERGIHSRILGLPEPDGIDMGTRAGMPVVGCGCEVVRKWLTRHYVRCLCGVDLNREVFWEAALSVEVFRPVAHCGRWTPLNLDPEDRYHALACTAKGRIEAAERKDEIIANWKAQKPGFFSDERPLSSPGARLGRTWPGVPPSSLSARTAGVAPTASPTAPTAPERPVAASG